MSGRITLITGGTGAGKTSCALELASSFSSKIYIATAAPADDEMRAKIAAHQAERDESYVTLEEQLELGEAVSGVSGCDVAVVDCITFWVNNLQYYEKDEDVYFENLCKALRASELPVILVTNEVGLGLIPFDKATRAYARNLAVINRKLAELADSVLMMVSGIPLKIK